MSWLLLLIPAALLFGLLCLYFQIYMEQTRGGKPENTPQDLVFKWKLKLSCKIRSHAENREGIFFPILSSSFINEFILISQHLLHESGMCFTLLFSVWFYSSKKLTAWIARPSLQLTPAPLKAVCTECLYFLPSCSPPLTTIWFLFSHTLLGVLSQKPRVIS